MNIVEIQRICATDSQPNDAQLESWVNTVLANLDDDSEIVIRIVDEIESAQLNETYRHKQGATNILSFPVDVPDEIELNLLGDLVICAPVLEREATEQNKPLHNHWAHIVIHGTLHLLGYDHIEDTDAEEMETKEIALLQTLSIPNPYENGSDL
ncbi:MAG: rRNA maturation RNase YbeY [Methylococcales bacterium]|nr:rRNA maturation RNase YbeY [Methylococcales bacterium]